MDNEQGEAESALTAPSTPEARAKEILARLYKRQRQVPYHERKGANDA